MENNKPIPIKDILVDHQHPLYEMVSETINKLNSGEISMCACMGKMGNDPYCPCEMRNRGLKATTYTEKQMNEHAKFIASLVQETNKLNNK